MRPRLDNIASQNNLLALYATIEAARASEQAPLPATTPYVYVGPDRCKTRLDRAREGGKDPRLEPGGQMITAPVWEQSTGEKQAL